MYNILPYRIGVPAISRSSYEAIQARANLRHKGVLEWKFSTGDYVESQEVLAEYNVKPQRINTLSLFGKKILPPKILMPYHGVLGEIKGINFGSNWDLPSDGDDELAASDSVAQPENILFYFYPLDNPKLNVTGYNEFDPENGIFRKGDFSIVYGDVTAYLAELRLDNHVERNRMDRLTLLVEKVTESEIREVQQTALEKGKK